MKILDLLLDLYQDEGIEDYSLKDIFINKQNKSEFIQFYNNHFSSIIKSGVKKISKKKVNFTKASIVYCTEGTPYAIGDSQHTVAQGTEGSIRIAQNLLTDEFCLVKVKKSDKPENLSVESQNEYIISSEYSEDYILGHQEIISDTKGTSYLFMKELNGILIEHLPTMELKARDKLKITYNLLLELKKLGQKKICHNDINWSNIIIDSGYNIHFIDFGRSTLDENMDGMVYGYDFDAICEIIDDLCLTENNIELEEKLKSKLTQAKNDEGVFAFIDIDEILSDVKNILHGKKSTIIYKDFESNDERTCKRYKMFHHTL